MNTNAGLYWLKSDSPARGAALAGICGPTNFFGVAQSSVSDVGFVQYNAAYTNDSRTLDPSPAAGADYWLDLNTTNPPPTSLKIIGGRAIFGGRVQL